MNPFSLLIKPTSSDCNLKCRYCFYLDTGRNIYPETDVHRMSHEVLHTMIRKYMATDQPQYAFSWQGGEPALMGLDFYKRVTDLQQRYGRPGSHVSNGLQTNTTLIDDAWARHLAMYRFLVGVSLDGPGDMHNRFRLHANGRGSHADVFKGIESLQRHHAEFNIITLVTQANVDKPREVYRYLVDHGFSWHQYIPCVEFDGSGNLTPFSITGRQWGDWLCAVYDEWIQDSPRHVSVRQFDAILTLLVDGTCPDCHMGRDCCRYFVVEYNGDVYPCDFFVQPDLKLGNILTHEWEDLQKSLTYINFGALKDTRNGACSTCEFLDFCAGDCLKHRLPRYGDPGTLSSLCEGWKMFYQHSLPGLRHMAAAILREREEGMR